jgi:hypothetical protein
MTWAATKRNPAQGVQRAVDGFVGIGHVRLPSVGRHVRKKAPGVGSFPDGERLRVQPARSSFGHRQPDGATRRGGGRSLPTARNLALTSERVATKVTAGRSDGDRFNAILDGIDHLPQILNANLLQVDLNAD